MKYIPAIAASLAIGAAVSVGLYFTKDVNCLIGLAAFWFVRQLLPDYKGD